MKIKEIDEMDWKKQIEKLEDELQKLTESENKIAERKKEVEEKLRKAKEQKENEENKIARRDCHRAIGRNGC